MDVFISVPDELVQQIQNRWKDLSRGALESLAIEAYRGGVITEAQVQRMLDLPSRWETDRFLKNAQAYIDYTEADLLEDIEAIRGRGAS
ncbi:MAG: UPF0175 family protein [Syntrophobacteraceae bacterium]